MRAELSTAGDRPAPSTHHPGAGSAAAPTSRVDDEERVSAPSVHQEIAGPGSAAREPLYLTAQQVAAIVQVDEKTVSRWSLEDPSMPVLRRGRVVRFPRERLLAWLERQEPRSAR